MYVIIWEFIVQPERVTDFVAAYKSDGVWARLFAQADGYLETELFCASADATCFLTIDRWKSADDFTRFQERFSAEYRRLDTQLEGLTVSERKLGTFIRQD